MPYVVTENCIRCKYMDCVNVCPVKCFYKGENMLVLHPEECIDCVYEPECPANAITPDTEDFASAWIGHNARYANLWPNITIAKAAPGDADNFDGIPNKLRDHFSESTVLAMPNLDAQPATTFSSSPTRYALEVTAKDIVQIEASRAEIPPGSPINIAFLGNEDHAQRISAARVIRRCGFEPVPIISSRRLRSQADLDNLLSGLIGEANPTRFILVGGDPATPAGPYADSLALLKSGILHRYAIRHVGIVAYPEGHPRIATNTLWQALAWKLAFLKEAGCTVEITTQFGFDADAIVRWIERLRGEGVDVPVRVGVPGPADVGKLLRYAKQFGVATSTEIVRRYGLPLTNLLQRVGPERYIDRLVAGLRGRDLGPVLYHLYPFGGIIDAVRWMNSSPSFNAASPTHP